MTPGGCLAAVLLAAVVATLEGAVLMLGLGALHGAWAAVPALGLVPSTLTAAAVHLVLGRPLVAITLRR
jgi:hypothetical protein